MNSWIWVQKNWRTWLLRSVLLEGLWLLLAFLVATEFYFVAQNGPIRISWLQAAESAIRDWFPWMLLFPVIVVLADLFRFDRQSWKRSLLAHWLACAVIVILYDSIETLFIPRPFQVASGVGFARLPPNGPLAVIGEAGERGQMVSSSNFNAPTHGFGFGGGVSAAGSFAVNVENSAGIPGSPPILTAVTGPPPGAGFSISVPPGNAPGRVLAFGPRSRSWQGLFSRAVFRTQFTAPVYWCVVCACWMLTHWRESHERERRALELEARLTHANLRALKMQLQPHFLFNTLNAISSLIHENSRAADDMVGSLSALLRMNLDTSTENEVPLQRELEMVDRYLEIQQARFGDRLQIHREIDDEARNALVPPLLLQPLVENAIRHGIEARECGGAIRLEARRQGEWLSLEVYDDGAGLKSGDLLRSSEGIGLSNTKARLRALYGERHLFRLTANHPAGAIASVEIPFRLAEPNIELCYEYSIPDRG